MFMQAGDVANGALLASGERENARDETFSRNEVRITRTSQLGGNVPPRLRIPAPAGDVVETKTIQNTYHENIIIHPSRCTGSRSRSGLFRHRNRGHRAMLWRSCFDQSTAHRWRHRRSARRVSVDDGPRRTRADSAERAVPSFPFISAVPPSTTYRT